MSGQTMEELREVAEALSGALQLASQENDTLKRQVEVLAKKIGEYYADIPHPETFAGYRNHWEELSMLERTQEWLKWSLEQAKKGHP